MKINTQERFATKYIDSIQVDPNNNYFNKILQETLGKIPEPLNICDVGCGNGLFSIMLKKLTKAHLTGIDGSNYGLQKAHEIGFDKTHHINDFSFDILPFGDGVFDLVINKDVLEHLIHPEHLVREISRIIRNGGYVLFHVPNHFTLVGRLKLLFLNTIDAYNYFPDSNRWNFPHIRFFNNKDFLNLIQKEGFEPIENFCHYHKSFPKIGRLMSSKLKINLSNKFPDLFAEGFTYLFRK